MGAKMTGTCKMMNADTLGPRNGDRAQRHCGTGELTNLRHYQTGKLMGLTSSWEAQDANLESVSLCHKYKFQREQLNGSRGHQPWKAGDCGAITVTGLVIGADEKGSSEGVLKALVICEHRELILSASPSTSGTARQIENGSRQKNWIILKYNSMTQGGIL